MDAAQHSRSAIFSAMDLDHGSTSSREHQRYRKSDAATRIAASHAAADEVVTLVQDAAKGRRDAVGIAREEATQQGTPWQHNDSIHYESILQRSAPTGLDDLVADKPEFMSTLFLSDDIRELLDLAGVAMRRRVVDAVEEASKARSESLHDEARLSDDVNSTSASAPFTKVHTQKKARMTALVMLSRGHKSAEKLRAALVRLEKEAVLAQRQHAGDLCSLTTRLVAQREAMVSVLTPEIGPAESHLQPQIRDHKQHLVECWELHLKQLEEKDRVIANLKREHAAEKSKLSEKIGTLVAKLHEVQSSLHLLEGEKAALEAPLATSRRQHMTDVQALKAELPKLEAEVQSQREEHATELAKSKALRRDEAEKFMARITDARSKLFLSTRELGRVRRENKREAKTIEAQLTQQWQKYDAKKAGEERMLRSRLQNMQNTVEKLKIAQAAPKLTRSGQFAERLRVPLQQQRVLSALRGEASPPPPEPSGWKPLVGGSPLS